MKIDKILSQSDLIANLKRAAALSNMYQLDLLGEYIRQEKDLKNLKDGLVIEEYEIKLIPGAYEVLVIKSKFNSIKKVWEKLDSKVVETITFEELKQMEEANKEEADQKE